MNRQTSTEGERQAAADCLNQLVTASQQIQRARRDGQPSGILALDSSRGISAAVHLVGLHQSVALDHLASFAGLLLLPGSHGQASPRSIEGPCCTG